MSSESIINDTFNLWCQAIKTQDPDQVLPLYAPNAVLLPTLSDQLCNRPDQIRDYFIHFLKKQPVCQIDEGVSKVNTDAGLAFYSGHYTFQMGDQSQVKARFTFVYEQQDGQWLISSHHSSLQPS